MEDYNKNWFDPLDNGFSEIWGSEKNKQKNEVSFNSNENSANQADNNFLNKKRKMLKTKKEYISEIRRLIHEGGLEEEYLFIKRKIKKSSNNNIPIDYEINQNVDNSKCDINNKCNENVLLNNNKPKNNEEKKIETKPIKPIQQTKSLHEWYKKLNLLPFNNTSNNIISPYPYDDNHKDGYVKFYGFNNIYENNDSYNYNKFYIYLREQNEFEASFNNTKIYEWEVTILCDSFLIGVGLAEKNIVLSNNNKFLSDDDKFNNGVYCLINTYNKEFNMKEMRPWHCNDKNLINHVTNFPPFKKGRKINMIYNNNSKTLEFISKKNSYKMINVFPKGFGVLKILTPCVVFYYAGDEIQFSQLNIK